MKRPPPPISLGKWMGPVQVTHIEDAGRVWVSLDADREKVMAEVDAVSGKLDKLDGKIVKEGSLVATTFSEDGAVYRAIVKKISGKEVEVVFCDFGNGETVDMNELMELPKVLESQNPVAVMVHIEGNEGVEDNEKNRAKVDKKLMVDNLMVKLSQEEDKISARFAVDGKKIKFGKSKDKKDSVSLDEAASTATPEAKEVVKTIEIAKSPGKVVMCSQLPALEIIKNVKYDGLVNYVSSVGTVWFRPSWTFPSINDLSAKFEELGAKSKLQTIEVEDIAIGLLCVARNGLDGLFYRARVIQELENSVCSVKYIDYGDSERVPLYNLFYYPPGLDMVAPGAEEIILARQPKAEDVQTLLTDTLMDVEGVQLYLEIDETGSKVGRFYINGEEMKWDEKITAKEVFTKDERSAEDNEDVVVEEAVALKETVAIAPTKEVPSEDKIVTEVAAKTVIAKATVPKEQTPEVENKDVPVKETVKNTPKLTRLVAPDALVEGKEHKVTLQDVESTSRVYVCKEEDLARVEEIMEKMASLNDLQSPIKVPKGAVFGARFSQDKEFYRVATVSKQEDQQFLVQFIDFGNKESKSQSELFILPEDLADEPSAAVAVDLDTGLEDNEENRNIVDSLLAQDSLTVVIENGKGTFFTSGNLIRFRSQEVVAPKEAELTSPVSHELEKPAVKESLAKAAAKDPPLQPPPVSLPKQTKAAETLPIIEVKKPAISKAAQIETEKNVQRPKFQSGDGTITDTPLKLAHSKEVISEASKAAAKPIQDVDPPSMPAAVEKPKMKVTESQCFVKAISDLQSKPVPRRRPELNQDRVKRKAAVVGSGEDVTDELQWRQGETVVVKCADGVWRDAKVVASKMSRVFVTTCDNDTVWVEVKHVRSSSIPANALNKIDKDINCNTMMRETGDGADIETADLLSQAVDKVKSWMERNSNNQDMVTRLNGDSNSKVSQLITKKLPEGSKLVDYCRTRPGSEHVQSVLNTSNVQLARNVLTTLLCHCNPIVLITGHCTSFVIQKLISVLPSSELDAIHDVILTNFLELSLDKSGCRIVQIMLEFSNESQQRQLTSQLCDPSIVITLACDVSGTYVAQACLPHLLQTPDQLQGLVLTVLPNIVELGKHPQGTFFLQRLIGVLNNYPSSVGLHLLFEEILKGLSQLILSEPGSRFLQAVLKECPKGVFIRVCNWVVDNMESVVIIKPAVFLAREMIIQIELVMANDDSWRFIMEQFVRALMEPDQDSVEGAPLLVTASLHACGHILTREIVSRINLVSGGLRDEMMFQLGANVDTLSFSKTGSYVLKGLEAIMI